MEKDLLSKLIARFACLPGVGQKTAQRYVYYLLERDRQNGTQLGEDLLAAMEHIGNCQRCRMFTEQELCAVCANETRDDSLICVVEGPADVAAIEANAHYRGLYFVLHGRLSPIDNIGVEEIGIPLLEERLKTHDFDELIIAMSTTVEGDVTAHLIRELAQKYGVKVSQIAQGIPVGGELEYIDASTLLRAFDTRT